MKSLFLTFATICALAQGTFVGNGVSQETLKGLQSEISSLGKEMKFLTKDLVDGLTEEYDDKANKLESHVDNTLYLLQMHPDRCKIGLDEHMERLKSASVGSFITCSNMTKAIGEMGTIVYKTMKLAGDLFLIVHDALQITVSCNTYNPITFVKCWWSKMDELKNDLEEGIADAKNYVSDVKELAKEIKANIDSCFKPHKYKLINHLNVITDKVRECAADPKANLHASQILL